MFCQRSLQCGGYLKSSYCYYILLFFIAVLAAQCAVCCVCTTASAVCYVCKSCIVSALLPAQCAVCCVCTTASAVCCVCKFCVVFALLLAQHRKNDPPLRGPSQRKTISAIILKQWHCRFQQLYSSDICR